MVNLRLPHSPRGTTNTSPLWAGWPLIAAIALIGLLVVATWWIPNTLNLKTAEIVLGLVVVLSLSVLVVLFYIVAAGFASLGLADPKHALGLPEGSIRAMIAVLLLVTFIIVSLYLFGRVGLKYPDPNSPSTTDEGVRIAAQLITLLGTLVGTVSGFYFGTTALRAGRQAMTTSSPAPTIRDLKPVQGKQGTDEALVIRGKDFRGPPNVRLVRGNEEIEGRDVVANTSEIRTKVTLDKAPGAKWDLLVVNEDGKQDRLAEAFEIV